MFIAKLIFFNVKGKGIASSWIKHYICNEGRLGGVEYPGLDLFRESYYQVIIALPCFDFQKFH